MNKNHEIKSVIFSLSNCEKSEKFFKYLVKHKMPDGQEEKGAPSKIDQFMVDIDLTKKFHDRNTGSQYEIGNFY